MATASAIRGILAERQQVTRSRSYPAETARTLLRGSPRLHPGSTLCKPGRPSSGELLDGEAGSRLWSSRSCSTCPTILLRYGPVDTRSHARVTATIRLRTIQEGQRWAITGCRGLIRAFPPSPRCGHALAACAEGVIGIPGSGDVDIRRVVELFASPSKVEVALTVSTNG